MALTDHCDLFVSIHEEGVNRIVGHVMRQRPSWLNFATPDVAANRELWCQIPEFTSDVTKFGDPIFTVMPYLPVIGVDSPPVGMGFCVQVVRAQVDFHPGNVIALPPELGPTLQEQCLALEFKVCGGIRCPEPRVLDTIPVTPPPDPRKDERQEPQPPVPVPGRMNCFCLDVYAIAHVEREFMHGTERLVAKVDGIEIVDIEPGGLEDSIECYVRTAVSLFLRQKLAIPLETLFLDFPLFGLGTVSLSPTSSPQVPHNPAVEDDQLKAFVTMTVTP